MTRCMLLFTFALSVLGCGKRDETPTKKVAPEDDAKHLLFAEPGHKFHIRLTIDKEAKKAVAEVRDESDANQVPIEEQSVVLAIKEAKAMQIDLTPIGVKDKRAWQFEAVHERLGSAIDRKKIELNATIEGKNYRFELDEGHD